MSTRRKTLVVLTPAFPADESETNWVTTQQLLVRTLQKEYPSLQVIVLSFYYPEKTAAYAWHGVPVIPFEGRKNRKLRRIFFWRSLWRQLKKIRAEHELMGLFSFWCGECALIGHYFGKRYGIRHFCWLCGQDARATNKMVKLIRPRPEELIGMSDFLVKEFYRNHGIRPRYMIPNGIDPEMFPHAGEEAHTGKSAAAGRDIDILGVGSLSRMKRYDLFVEVVGIVKEAFPGIRARHCGDGEDLANIRQRIRSAGLEENMILMGEQRHGEALGVMQRAKVFLHPSSYEGFGVVCLEALYAGAHVISFCRPMDREIPRWHIVDTPSAMAAKAIEILSGPAMDHRPVLPYSMADMVKAVMQLFES